MITCYDDDHNGVVRDNLYKMELNQYNLWFTFQELNRRIIRMVVYL